MLVILMAGFTAGPSGVLVGIADGVARDGGLVRLEPFRCCCPCRRSRPRRTSGVVPCAAPEVIEIATKLRR